MTFSVYLCNLIGIAIAIAIGIGIGIEIETRLAAVLT